MVRLGLGLLHRATQGRLGCGGVAGGPLGEREQREQLGGQLVVAFVMCVELVAQRHRFGERTFELAIEEQALDAANVHLQTNSDAPSSSERNRADPSVASPARGSPDRACTNAILAMANATPQTCPAVSHVRCAKPNRSAASSYRPCSDNTSARLFAAIASPTSHRPGAGVPG